MMKLKEEKGSISVIVVVSIVFFLAIASASYMLNATKAKTQLKNMGEVKKTYESEFNNVDEIYANLKGTTEEYELIDYIQSNGNQYIDTGFIPNQDTSVKINISFDDLNQNANIFCARDGYQVNSNTLFFVPGSGFRFDYNTSMNNFGSVELNTKYEIYTNKNKIYLNNELIKTCDEATFKPEGSLWLLASYKSKNDTIQNYAKAKLYGTKIWDDKYLVRDMKPCIRKSDNKAGLYDTITKQFYTNGGTGSFAGGND